MAERIDVHRARQQVDAGEGLLVCAYEDEDKCRKMALEGAITLSGLRACQQRLRTSDEIIFYCG